MKIKINNTILVVFFTMFFSCIRVENPFYFDIKTQSIYCCDKKRFYDIDIENESIKPNGYLYEGVVLIIWKDSLNLPPSRINFDSIPKGYIISRAGNISKVKYKLRPNCKYKLSKRGLGGVTFSIKIWTNFEGRVIKTSNPICP
ncbi:MAG: hypothetical protein PHT07_07705 [Paludibacter sp.]|nr:hypothetical protein [Paludibacter sp.]